MKMKKNKKKKTKNKLLAVSPAMRPPQHAPPLQVVTTCRPSRSADMADFQGVKLSGDLDL